MRQPLLIGNWKLHGTPDTVSTLLDGLKTGASLKQHTHTPTMVVLPPAIFIPQIAQSLKDSVIRWGGQDMSMHLEGAYTGDISGGMLKAFSCHYVLLGHSERRQHHGETDEQIVRKLQLAQQVGLTPILCIGETLAHYHANETEAILLKQLRHYLTFDKTLFQRLILAYEPIWAIGTGESASPQYIQTIHQRLRTAMAEYLGHELAHHLRILYGGSVKLDNAKALFAMPDVDGGLVGSASLSADAFLQIYRAFP